MSIIYLLYMLVTYEYECVMGVE